MVQVHFTAHLQRVAPENPIDGAGSTIREVLASVFAKTPGLKTYILDDQDRLRIHIAVFLDGEHLRGSDILSQPVKPDSELYILQALSGGDN
ncbi:MAG: MoaD/ThiS family protein [Rhodobacteraceae bacterium]|nr:MoaD/ThiS family protein [Paracoccaceae bacterium]